MARSIDQIVQEQLGGLSLAVARLQSENEQLREDNAALKAAKDVPAAPKV